MPQGCALERDTYFDSVMLMGVAARLNERAGVRSASLMMGTETNKRLLRDAGLLTAEGEVASANDLIIAVATDGEDVDALLADARRLLTAPDARDAVLALARETLGKEPIVAPDRAGFTVNALLIPYLLSAIRMVEQGLATAEDIDQGMVRGCGHPMGPLALADLIGLDTVQGVAETLYAEHREQLFAPPPLLQRLVAAGLLGRKTGRGLLSYEA